MQCDVYASSSGHGLYTYSIVADSIVSEIKKRFESFNNPDKLPERSNVIR